MYNMLTSNPNISFVLYSVVIRYYHYCAYAFVISFKPHIPATILITSMCLVVS